MTWTLLHHLFNYLVRAPCDGNDPKGATGTKMSLSPLLNEPCSRNHVNQCLFMFFGVHVYQQNKTAPSIQDIQNNCYQIYDRSDLARKYQQYSFRAVNKVDIKSQTRPD